MLSLNPSTGEPIYRQLLQQIERMISSGQLREGEYLPSVRELASELAVNPMTISKAYSLLENSQLVERIRGKGMMVKTTAKAQPLAQRLERLRPLFQSLQQQCQQLNIDKDQALAWFEQQFEQQSTGE